MKKNSFEGNLMRIEEIIKYIEGNEVSLDDSVKYFEEGMKLIRMCEMQLNETEQKISKLVYNGEGLLEEKFEEGSES